MTAGPVEPMRVLVVDDNADLVDVVAEFLGREHDAIETATAASAEEALEGIRADPPDCVVSDYDMPGRNGLELLRDIRETEPDLPFILFTGKGSEEIASEAISAGVTEYLQKGTATEQYAVLANRIERAVGERRARKRQAETQRRFTMLVENLPGMSYRCRNERGWPMEYVSDGCEELTGYTADQLVSGEIEWGEKVLHPDDRESMWESVQRATAAGEPFQVTYRIRDADGEIRWCWEQGQAVEREGETAAIEGFITDITPRKRREQELRAERDFTESALNALEDMFFVVDPETERLVRWNDRVPERTGYADSEMTGMRATEFVAQEHRERAIEAMSRAVTEGTTTVEVDLLTADGQRVPYEFRGTLIHDEDGELLGIAAVGRDTSDREERERELERYETVIQAVSDPVYALDDDGVLMFVNDATEAMTGYDAEELVGSHIRTIIAEEGAETGRHHIQEMLADPDGDARAFEVSVHTRDGEEVPSEFHIALLPTDDGQFRGTAGIIRDIESRKKREERLERFASVVSHDLRGPLNVILGQVELASEHTELDELDAIAEAADRMNGLIDDLLTLARQGQTVGEVEEVSLSSVAERAWHAIDTADATLESWVTLTLSADSERLRELLENLYRNAIEHGSRDVTVTVGRLDDGDGFYVADDGPGIPAAKRTEVFEHGYTTDEQGTGFGLSIVKRVAEAHGWTVSLTESADGGARFDLRTG